MLHTRLASLHAHTGSPPAQQCVHGTARAIGRAPTIIICAVQVVCGILRAARCDAMRGCDAAVHGGCQGAHVEMQLRKKMRA